MNIKILIAALLSVFPPMSFAEGQVPTEVFAKLKSLMGDWEARNQRGGIVKVSYRTAAQDSIVIESWTLAPNRDSLTIYHMDGDRLLATHYCPLGNQPRLRFDPATSTNDKYAFKFIDATNLRDTKSAHEEHFELSVIDIDTLTRSETYVQDSKDSSSSLTFHRIK